MIRVSRWLTAALLTGLLLGCATSADSPLTVYQKLDERDLRIAEPVDRIHDYRIDGWNYLDPQHLILHGGVNERYLVTLVRRCYGLQSNYAIGFTTTVSTLTTYDKILVRDVGNIVDECHIAALHRLEKTGPAA